MVVPGSAERCAVAKGSPLSRLPLYIVNLAICPDGVRGGMFAPVNNNDTE